jgi:tetratricopeptide (TPR) repeat protein
LGARDELDARLMRAAALLESDPAAAAREAEAILALEPGHATAVLLLGTARRGAGNLDAAAHTFGALADSQPDSGLLQLELGRTLHAQGDLAGARAALTRAVQLEPGLAQGWRELSLVHAQLDEPTECDRAYARFASLVPEDNHLAEAQAALAQERLGYADALLKRVLAAQPQDVAALRLSAEVAAARDDYPHSEHLLGECLKIAPGDARARLELVRVLHAQQKAAAMLPLLERLLVQEPASLQYRTLEASAHSILGQNERAAQIIADLLVRYPDNEWAWLHYGHVLRSAGRLQESIAAYRRSIDLKPQFGEAWFSLANLKTLRFSAADIATMHEQLARTELPEGERLQFEFALGKALEDEKDYRGAFEHYARGNELRHAQVRYDPELNSALVQRTERLFDAQFLAARKGWGDPSADPIFIVGLPRSGSTLLEQILASHSQVEGTRELFDMYSLAFELGLREEPGEPSVYPQGIARLSRGQLAALGARYLQQTRPYRPLGRPRFIDKMPLNFLQTGLIHLVLPNARIIDARRAPLACCFANFKQHFQRGAWFAYSLADLGRYYRDYVRLMAHFDQVLPGRVHRVQYEHLVQDLEGEVRRLLDYCGLPYEEQCLRFHETRRVVQTASSEQVRRPLYVEGLEQWRHFEPWLGPLKDALGNLAGA